MLNLDELKKQIDKLNTASEEYVDAIYKKYTDYIDYSELPPAFLNDDICKDSLPKYTKTLYDNINTIINERYNLVFSYNDYKYTHNIATMLINSYFIKSAKCESTLNHVLYIDTNLLMSDYKLMIERSNSEDEASPTHKLVTLNKRILEAEYVIWDKCTMLKSAYERDKFYDIMSIRHRSGLGNLFIITGSPRETLPKCFDNDTVIVMDFDTVIDCSKEQVQLISGNRKESIEW